MKKKIIKRTAQKIKGKLRAGNFMLKYKAK